MRSVRQSRITSITVSNKALATKSSIGLLATDALVEEDNAETAVGAKTESGLQQGLVGFSLTQRLQ